MRVKTVKSIFLLGFWTFLLLFLKESFPKAAYASSCTVSLACAEVLAYEAGSALAPAVAAPTAAGSASTISVTTATGVTTTEAAAGVAVVGDMRLTGLAAYYVWDRFQNERAQNKAKEKYCQSQADNVACGGKGSPTPTAWFPNTITFTKQPDGIYYLYRRWITPQCTASLTMHLL